MKTFFAGVLATVLAGILLLVSQDWIKREILDSKPRLETFEYAPEFITNSAEVKQWEEGMEPLPAGLDDGRGRIAIEAVVIENRGNAPIQSQNVIISTRYDDFDEGILAFKNDIVPGNVGTDTKMSLKDGALSIEYGLLDIGEMHRFWIIKDRYSDLKFTIRNPNINVMIWDAKIYTSKEGDFLTTSVVFGIIILLLLGMIIGALLDYITMSKAFSRQGMDLLEFMKKNSEIKKSERGSVGE